MTSTLVSASLNSTVLATSTLTNNITETIVNGYDYEGAAIYVAVILIWYSTGLGLMLFLQVRPHKFDNQFLLDYQPRVKSKSSSMSAYGNYHNVEADHIKRHILNELKDPDRRQRLWKIYYSSKEKQNEPNPRYYETITADSATIGRINRKLADIHRIDEQNRDDSVLASLDMSINMNRFDLTKSINKKPASSRRTSASGTTTTNREPLSSIPSQIEPPPSPKINNETSKNETRIIVSTSTINGSRKRIPKFSNRFVIEKVEENNVNHFTATQENA